MDLHLFYILGQFLSFLHFIHDSDSKIKIAQYPICKTNMAVRDLVLLEGINSVLYKAELFLVVCFLFNLPINGQSECL